MFRYIKTFFYWIVGYFGYEYIEPATDNLEEIAKLEIQKILEEIINRKYQYPEIRENSMVDVLKVPNGSFNKKNRQSLPTTQFKVPILHEHGSESESFDLHEFDIIQVDPKVFKATFFDQKKFAMKRTKSKFVENEVKIAGKLAYHENILTYFVRIKQLDKIYIAMEEYTCSLDRLEDFEETNFELKDVFKQVSKGLKFMHDSKIAHRYLKWQNIAVVMRGTTLIYKISNFQQAKNDASEFDLKDDIEDLGYLLENLINKFTFNTYNKNPLTADEFLSVNLINEMTKYYYEERPMMKDVLTHPYLWTPHETLHFIVQIAKILEAKDKTMSNILEESARNVYPTDWRSYIFKDDVIHLLKATNPWRKPPAGGMIGLVKTIRNLVCINFLTFYVVILYWNYSFLSRMFTTEKKNWKKLWGQPKTSYYNIGPKHFQN